MASDLNSMHTIVYANAAITMDEMKAAYSLIGRQPREYWRELAGALGLDGEEPHLNRKARWLQKVDNAP